MATNVTFHISSGSYPSPEICTPGALYVNTNVKTIYYASDANTSAPVANYTTAKQTVLASDTSSYKIGSINYDNGSVDLYGKRCAIKEVNITAGFATIPTNVGDMRTYETTVDATTLGGAFVGYSFSYFSSPYSGGRWSGSPTGVTIGTTTSGGTASYKIGISLECRTKPNSSVAANDGTVKLNVYYIPF